MTGKDSYIILPGRGLKKGGTALIVRTRARLYMGADHLLCLYNTGYTEDYKRFYYKDIQAIVACGTSKGKTLNIVLGVLIALHALISFLAGNPWNIIFPSIAVFFSLFLVINILLGPTSKSYLLTAVTTEELPSLCRLKNALKVIDLLRPVIETAQGRLSTEDIRLKSAEIQMREMPVSVPAGTRSIRRAAPSSSVGPVSNYSGIFHIVLFPLLVLCAAYSAVDIVMNHIAVTYAGIIIISVTVIFAILSAIKQHGSAMQGGLIGLTWSALIYLLVHSLLLYGIYIFTGIMNPASMGSQAKMLLLYTSLDPFGNPFLMGVQVLSAAYYFVSGIAGLVLLKKFRSSPRGA